MYKKLLSFYRSFKKDKKGSTAIEFAMIAPMLLFLTFATLELSFYNYLRANIENRTHNAARTAITGYQPNNTQNLSREDYFKTLLKEELDIATIGSFTPMISSEVFANFNTIGVRDKDKNNKFGKSQQIVKITITGTYDFMTPLLGILANNINQFKFETSVFVKNEYF